MERFWNQLTFEDHLLNVSISMMVALIFTKIGNVIENRQIFMLLNVIAQTWLYCEDF